MKLGFHFARAGWKPSFILIGRPIRAGGLARRLAGRRAGVGGTGTGADVEVMSPPEVRAELAAVALEIVDLYSNLRLRQGTLFE